MAISRRDFLISGWALVLGTWVLSKLSSHPLRFEEGTDQKNTLRTDRLLPPFLGEKVGFLRGKESVERFAETIADIDGSVRILSTRKKSRFEHATLEIQAGLTYADIPTLLISVLGAIPNSVNEEKIRDYSKKYREKSLLLVQMAHNSKDTDEKDFLKQNGLHYFFVACLFEGRPISKNILKDFENLILHAGEWAREVSEETRSKITTLVSGLKKESIIVSGKPFSLALEKKVQFQKDFEKNPETALVEYLKVIEDFILNSYPEQQTLFPIIRNILIVSFKISETFSDFQEQNTKGLIFQNLHDKTVDFFANKLEKQNENKIERLKKAQQDIDTDIQKEIVRDFESSLYYMMMDDFVLKNDLRSAIAESFKNIQTKLVINSYLSMFESKTLKGKRKEFFELKGKLIQAPEVMKDIIHSIQNLFPKEISEEIRDFLLFLETKTYSNIVKALAKGDFDSAKKRLWETQGKERRYLLYILTSTSGYYINNISKGSSILEGNYQADKFELANLKKKETKYNCMSISALNNYALEELFWLTGLWMNFHKYQWVIQSHQTNAIDSGNGEVLVSDVTNDTYFFIKNDGLHPKYTYDIDRYANTYMSGAYFNIHGKYARKYFDNIFYQAYTEFTGKQYFDYILKLQQSGKNNTYAIAWRKRLNENI